MDGWDFKQYVLGILFYRYISENLTSYINRGEQEAGNPDFDYAALSDSEAEAARAGLVEEKGFFILPSELFQNVRKRAAQDENLNETLEAVFRNLRLVKLINGVADMKLCDYQDNTIDAFGDAYEFLMGMYASNAGKSGASTTPRRRFPSC